MDSKSLDTITIITALVLIPLVAISGHAYYVGTLPFDEYISMWKEPVTLLIGFWLRGALKES